MRPGAAGAAASGRRIAGEAASQHTAEAVVRTWAAPAVAADTAYLGPGGRPAAAAAGPSRLATEGIAALGLQKRQSGGSIRHCVWLAQRVRRVQREQSWYRADSYPCRGKGA